MAALQIVDAIRSGRIDVVREAIAAGLDLNQIPADAELTPLMAAAEVGQVEILRLLLEAQVDVDLPDRHQHTALTHAVAGGSLEAVELLIAARAALNRVGELWPYNTPLMFAVMKGRAAIARALLEGGADIDAADKFGNTALMKASQFGKVKAVRGLLRRGADPNKSNLAGQTALFCCLMKPKIAQALLDAGADPNHADDQGRTPLMIAANHFRAPCLRLLLKAGARPNPGGLPSVSPLWCTVRQLLAPPLRWLLDAGADPNLAWSEHDSSDSQLRPGTTPLMYAAAKGRVRSVRLLLDAGADASRVDELGQTALQLAIANRHADVAALLMPSAAALNAQDRRQLATGWLLRGAKTGDQSLVREALAHGVDVNLRDEEFEWLGFTPLMHACRLGHVDVVSELLAAGAEPSIEETTNLATGQRQTALHYAAENGHDRCVQLLVESRALLDPLDERGRTPLMLAAAGGKTAVVERLVRGGAALDGRMSDDVSSMATFAESRRGENETTSSVGEAASGREIPYELDRLADDGEGGQELPPFSAIEMAAYHGHAEIVRTLFEAGARDGEGALVAACLGLQGDVVRWLLEQGVKPLTPDEGLRCSPLHALGRFRAEVRLSGSSRSLNSSRRRATWLGDLSDKQCFLAKRLLKAGAEVDARDALGRTPLHAAVHNLTMQTVQAGDDDSYQLHQGHEVEPTRLVEVLLKAGANPQAADRFGRTPLMLSAVRDPFMGPYFRRTAEALVKAGADPNARDRYGRTSAMLAIRHRQHEAVLHMLRLGASPLAVDNHGRTLLHWAAQSGADDKVVRALIRAGVDPHSQDRDGLTALDYARDRQLGEVVELLKRAGVADNLGPIDEFCRAVEEQRWDDATTLLNDVTDLHRTVSQRSAWQSAVCSQRESLIKALLTRGANIQGRIYSFERSAYRPDGASALHWAAFYGFDAVARHLLEHGADPRFADERGRTPVTCAAQTRHFTLMDELLRAGGTLDPLAEIYVELREFPVRAQTGSYQAAVQAVTESIGVPSKSITGLESVQAWTIPSEADPARERSAAAKIERRLATLELLQSKVDDVVGLARKSDARESCTVLDMGDSYGCSDAWFIGLFPVRDMLAAVAAIGTFGNEQELSNADLLDFLIDLRRTEQFVVTAARRDALQLRFLADVSQPEQLAVRLYRICSDVIHQGYGTRQRLVSAIRDERVVRLWWD